MSLTLDIDRISKDLKESKIHYLGVFVYSPNMADPVTINDIKGYWYRYRTETDVTHTLFGKTTMEPVNCTNENHYSSVKKIFDKYLELYQIYKNLKLDFLFNTGDRWLLMNGYPDLGHPKLINYYIKEDVPHSIFTEIEEIDPTESAFFVARIMGEEEKKDTPTPPEDEKKDTL